MKPFKVIKGGAEAFHVLGDETRRRIIYLLRAKELTVSQIAAELDLTPQAIYHHIRKLREADMVEVAREERVDHFIETYYRATAEVFYIEHGKGETREVQEARIRGALEALGRLGLTVPADAETVSKVVEIERRLQEEGTSEDLADRVAALDDVDFLTRQDVLKYAKFVGMSEAEFQTHLKLTKQLRDQIRSRVAETVAER